MNSILLAVAVALVMLAAATPTTARVLLIAPDSTRSPHDVQLDHVHAATPNATITVFDAPCFDGQPGSCTTPYASAIWLEPGAGRSALLHELGHRFDYLMSEHARRRFLTLIDQQDRAWRSPPNSPHEQFAEAWRLCATDPRRLRPAAYDYRPTRREHRCVCRTIRREAQRQNWTR